MEDATTICTNCQRPIAASNFVTHNLHCQRNLTKCDKCGEAIPRSAVEEHEFEFHAKVSCPDCHLMLERVLLETHKKSSCRSRQQHCRYCELELPACEMAEHENYCGSRTKKCEDCGEYVMFKYEQLHLDSNHSFLKLDDEPGPTATWIKNDLESGSSRPAKSNNIKPQLNTGKFENSDDGDDGDAMSHLFASLVMQPTKVRTKPYYPGVVYPVSDGTQRTVSRSPPPYQQIQDESDLVALPCEFCEAMIPVNQLILHQSGCQNEVTLFSKVAKLNQQKTASAKLNPAVDHHGNDDSQGSHLDGVDHSTRSMWEDISDWKVSENALSHDVRRNAIDEGNSDTRRNDISGRKNSNDGNEAGLRQDMDESWVYLPCEFCGDGYPASLLLEHQNVCEYHPKQVPEAIAAWTDSQEGAAGRPKGPFDSLMSKKFEFKDSDQNYSSGNRGKSNIDSYNDLRGNFTVASEWGDDSDPRPSSATGAIPKQKAGKLNFSRKVGQEEASSRSSYPVRSSFSRNSIPGQRIRIQDNLRGLKDNEGDENDDILDM